MNLVHLVNLQMRAISFIIACHICLGVSGICDFTDDITSCYNKFLSFEAIGDIHKYLDDDKNGEVDSSEAAKFVRDEFSPAERAQQRRSLPREDPYISLTDLWTMWQRNPAFNWTVKQTIRWLVDYVDLPQYEDIFMKHSINGKALPLLAMSNASYLTDVLMIRNPIHKKKIMVKALDTILFGPPKRRSLLSTETSLVTASCGLMMIVLVGFSHWAYCTYFPKTSPDRDSSSLSATENVLKDFQSRLDDLERLRFALNSCEQDTQNMPLTEKRHRSGDPLDFTRLSSIAESKRQSFPHLNDWTIESRVDSELKSPDSGLVPSPVDDNSDGGEETDSILWLSKGESARALSDWDAQQTLRRSTIVPENISNMNELTLWLQLTYELEMQQYLTKKTDAERHLHSIRQACKRLHRKRYTILGSVRLIHSDSLDDLERRLIQAKLVLEQLQIEMHERHTRWTRIETLLGVKVRDNIGLSRVQQLLTTNFGSALSLSADQHARVNPSSDYEICSSEAHELRNSDAPLDEDTQSILHLKRRDIGRAGTRTAYGRAQMPRNYSFVRPFATLWRRKVGSHSLTTSQTSQ